MAYTFDQLKNEYKTYWDQMAILSEKLTEVKKIAVKLYNSLPVYKEIERLTGVPAVVVMVLHNRESNGNFGTYLGNGQPWNRVTTIVPKGRGPFTSFVDGAVDALVYDGLALNHNWTVELALFSFEKYNGWGYRMYHPDVDSPYVWAGTNIQDPGKYVADGQFNRTAYDSQIGCAPLMKAIFDLDGSLKLPRMSVAAPVPIPVPTPVPIPVPVPEPAPEPTQGAWFVSLMKGLQSVFLSLFGKK